MYKKYEIKYPSSEYVQVIISILITSILIQVLRIDNLLSVICVVILVVDDDLSYDVELYYDGGKLFRTIATFSKDARLKSVGSVMATKELEYIWITLNDINEKYGIQEGYIFSPADSKEEANKLIKKELMKVTQ